MNEQLLAYAEEHSSEEPALLHALNRETHLKTPYPRMLSGHLQGRVLSMISMMIRPKTVLEIGTFTGYSAIALAEGMDENGTLYSIECNPELEDSAQSWFRKAGLENRIRLLIGDALAILPRMDPEISFGLVYLDADKENYPAYYKLLRNRLISGSFILADNVLWDGKVIDQNQVPDKETAGILAFNKMVKEDQGVENVILPIRDGISVIRVK